MYFSLFDVLPLVWCTSACLMYFSPFDVLPLVWCSSACSMYFRLFYVLPIVLCTSDCFMYFRLFDVLPFVWCTSDCFMYFRLFDVPPIVWCTSDCFMYFRLFDVLPIVLCTSDCLMYFRLYDVLQIVWWLQLIWRYFILFYVLQLTQNLAELRWTRNWYNYFDTDPPRKVLPPPSTVNLKRSYTKSGTRFSQSNYSYNFQLLGRTGAEGGSFEKWRLRPVYTVFDFCEFLIICIRYREANCTDNRRHSCATWRSWLRHCATSRKVAGSIPDGVTGNCRWHNPSGRIVALGSTQPLTEMSTRNTSLG